MIDVVLNGTDTSVAMGREVFRGLLRLLVDDTGHWAIALHADWNRAPDWLAEVLREMSTASIRLKACFNRQAPSRWINLFLASGHGVSLNVNLWRAMPSEAKDETSAALSTGAPQQKGMFLPLPSHATINKGLFDELAVIPPVNTLTLGPGWLDMVSGPEDPIALSDAQPWAKKLILLVTFLTSRQVTALFACGLPLCIFARNQLGKMGRMNIRTPIGSCGPALVVMPDGQITPCARLTSPRWDLQQGRSIRQLQTQINDYLSPFKSLCDRASALTCRSLRTGACGGGCLAEAMASWHAPKMHNGLSDQGRPQD